MRIIHLSAAIALSLGCSNLGAAEITVTTLEFYDATGAFKPDFGGFNDDVQGSVNSNANGTFNSGSIDFFNNPWAADQVAWFDEPGTHVWSGTGTAANTANAIANFTYTFTLAENQVAAGTFFDWSGNNNIPVLAVFKCGPNIGDPCTAVDADNDGSPGVAMVTTPFPSQTASFKGIAATVINAKPVANDDTTSTTVDTVRIINVLSNDTDFEDGSPPPAPPASVAPTNPTSTQGFALTANPDGTITYTPTGGYLGADDFQYVLTDSFGNMSQPAEVAITITASANTPPVANDTIVVTTEDTSLDIDVTTVAMDADGDPLAYSVFDSMSTSGGAITVNGTSTVLTYTPAANFNGTDTFTFSVTDGVDGSNVGTITVTVNPANDAPVCMDVDLITDLDTPLSISETSDLLAHCTDIEGDMLSVSGTTQPVVTGSTLSDDGAGTLTYTPAAGYTGDDSFDYTVTDGNAGVDTATANITVGVVFGNFTMLKRDGDVFGGTNDIIFVWDGVTFNTDETDNNFGVMTIASNKPEQFFGFVWTAHNVRVYGPGTYSFDTTCTIAQLEAGVSDCNNPLDVGNGQTERYMTMTVGPGQVGAHILFDWSTSADIDVVNVWDTNAVWDNYGDAPPKNALFTGPAGAAPDPTTTWGLVSIDVNGDGIHGSPMIDGPFINFYANFNNAPAESAAPPPPIDTVAPDTTLGASSMSLWSLFAGLFSLYGLRMYSDSRKKT